MTKQCAVEDCGRKATKRGWCGKHYQRWQRHGDPAKTLISPPKACAVEGCEDPARRRGWCMDHSGRFYRYGLPTAPLRRQPRTKGAPGARWITPDGYVMCYFPEHPNAKPDGKVLEHVITMTAHLGRPLHPDETVHHRNGERADNTLRNLELWSSSHPPGQRVEDKLIWAYAIIERYGAPS